MLQKEGYEIRRKVNNKEIYELEEENEDLIKENFNYSQFILPNLHCLNINNNKNPFRCFLNIHKSEIPAIIDSGADASIISKKNVPKDTKIEKANVKIYTADGSKLDIVGYVKNLKIVLKKSVYFFHGFVVREKPTTVILGVNFIKTYPQILENILLEK